MVMCPRLLRAWGVVVAFAACSSVSEPDSSPVSSVVVRPSSLSIAVGASSALVAEVLDGAGNPVAGRRVFWASQDASVAEVSADGVVTGRRAGSVQIAASADGKSALARATVSGGGSTSPPPAPPAAAPTVATVSINPPNATLFVGESIEASATARTAQGQAISGRTFVWTTSSGLVASVSQSGVVKGLLPGTASVVATVDGKSGSMSVTVRLVPVGSVIVTPSSTKVDVGKTVRLAAIVRDAANNLLTGRTVTWTSSDTRIATVDNTGLVLGVRKGSVKIIATSEGKEGHSNVSVED